MDIERLTGKEKEEELQALQRDAMRYRWLRKQNLTVWHDAEFFATGYGLDQHCDQGMKDER